MDETTGRHHVYGKRDHQQAGSADVRCLKVPVARPKAAADDRGGRHRQEQQRQQRDDARVFVAGRGQSQVLNDPMIGREEYSDVEDRSRKYQPAEELVMAQWKSAHRPAARPNR